MDARVAAFVVAVAWLAAAPARADDVRECTAAHEQAQVLRQGGKLGAAQRELLRCASAGCPDLVQEDCSRMLQEVETSQPTVVIEAVDAQGHETADVAVSVDGVRVAERLDGRALRIDPGEHTVRFERAGKVLEERLLFREGEKNRTLRADFGTLEPRAPAPKAPVPTAARAEPPPPAPTWGHPTSTWILAGLGVVGVGMFAVFGGLGKSEESSLDKCKPGCGHARVNDMFRDYAIADASLGVGVLSLAAAGVILLVQPKGRHAAMGASF
jgi:hypothetical protein